MTDQDQDHGGDRVVHVVCDHEGRPVAAADRPAGTLAKIDSGDGGEHDNGVWAFVGRRAADTPERVHQGDPRAQAFQLSCDDCGRAPRVNLRNLAPALDRLVAAGLDRVTLAQLDRDQ